MTTTQREPRIVREGATINYLTREQDGFTVSRVRLADSLYGVTRFDDSQPARLILTIGGGAFHFQDHLSAEEARLLGRALLLAADEADAA